MVVPDRERNREAPAYRINSVGPRVDRCGLPRDAAARRGRRATETRSTAPRVAAAQIRARVDRGFLPRREPQPVHGERRRKSGREPGVREHRLAMAQPGRLPRRCVDRAGSWFSACRLREPDRQPHRHNRPGTQDRARRFAALVSAWRLSSPASLRWRRPGSISATTRALLRR